MNQFGDIRTNQSEILTILRTEKPRVVGIDGIDGVGKTTLASNLSSLGYVKISIDDFLQKKSGGYFEYLRIDELKGVVDMNSKKMIVIEGILLLKILEIISLKTDFLIYVTDNLWLFDWSEHYDGKYSRLALCEIINKVEEEVNELNKIVSPGSKKYKMKGFRKEIYQYSFEYKPWNKANTILRKT